jgi:plastocyanin
MRRMAERNLRLARLLLPARDLPHCRPDESRAGGRRPQLETHHMFRTLSSIAIAFTASSLVACSDSTSANANTHVSIRDDCDPASFNAALGAGTCSKQGSTTFAQFNNELSATQQVAAWQFVPQTLTVRVGQAITATNGGGEVHTFTEVDQFGGGIVPALNQASGNDVEAPECQQLSAADMIAPGATFTADAETTVGTEHYQCCIHPWMRETVIVTG